MTDKNDMK